MSKIKRIFLSTLLVALCVMMLTALIACDTKYTVTLDPNGGSGGTKSVTVVVGEAMPTADRPTRDGHRFEGYYDAKDGKGVKYYDANMTSIKNWDKDAGGTLYANWQVWVEGSYVVTLNADGGTGHSVVFAIEGEAMPTATAPTRDNRSFGGYFTGKNGAGVQYYTAAMQSAKNWDIKADTTLYAYWISGQSTITLDPNGGIGGSAELLAIEGDPMPNGFAPRRAGYNFLGFFDSLTEGKKYYDSEGDNLVSVADWDKSENATLYARWEARIRDIRLDPNHSGLPFLYTITNKASDEVVTLPSNSEIPLDTFERYGYIFGGWVLDGQSTAYQPGEQFTMPANNSEVVVLKAKWTGVATTVTYVVKGYYEKDSWENTDATVANPTATINFGSSYTLDVPTRTGFTFLGWYEIVEIDGGDPATQDVMRTKATGESLAAWGEMRDVTLYAKWENKIVTATYDEQGGANTQPAIEKIPYGLPFTLKVSTYQGHVFQGWYTQAGGQGTKVSDENGVVINSAGEAGIWTIENDCTLYAHWEGYSLEMASGTGTIANPYIISTKVHLMSLSNTINNAMGEGASGYFGKYFKIEADIDLGGEAVEPIGRNGFFGFNGILDGNNKAIKNFTLTANSQYVGFFGGIGGTVKNLTLSDATINATASVSNSCPAAFVGYNTGIIENCEAKNIALKITKSTTAYTGGFVGFNNGTIKNSKTTNVEITSTSSTSGGDYLFGGFAGYNSNLIEKCRSESKIVVARGSIGGLVGWNVLGGVIDGGSVVFNVTATTLSSYSLLGGFVADNKGVVMNVTFSDEIISSLANVKLGGIAGQSANSGIIENCLNTATITGTGSAAYVGGIVGTFTGGFIRNCESTGDITSSQITGTSTNYAGGITANIQNQSMIINCKTSGTITGYKGTGGIIARFGGSGGLVSGCTSSANIVNGVNNTFSGHGGIAGLSEGFTKIENCTFTGTITSSFRGSSTSLYVGLGGIVGNASSSPNEIIGCVFAGTINDNSTGSALFNYVGGIAAYTQGTVYISDCYSDGTINTSASGNIGGIVGYQNANTAPGTKVLNSYALGTINSTGSAGNIGGLIGHANASTTAPGIVSGCFVATTINVLNSSENGFNIGGLIGTLSNTYLSKNRVEGVDENYRAADQIVRINKGTEEAPDYVDMSDSNTYGIKRAVAEINASFFSTVLGWDSQIWNFSEVNYAQKKLPTLKFVYTAGLFPPKK